MTGKMWSVVGVAALVIGLAGTGWAGPVNSIYNPYDGASFGDLVLNSSHKIEFNTQTVQYRVDTGSGFGSWISGSAESNQSGNVEAAVFRFDSVTINDGATVSVVNTGFRPLVITSTGDFYFDADLSLKGGSSANVATGYSRAGGAGGAGASDSTLVAPREEILPPTADAGKGGTGCTSGTPGIRPTQGVGLGGASVDGWDYSGGVGGGYGGQGGQGALNIYRRGAAYGDQYLTDLYGGSGGCSGIRYTGSQTTNGTGGGGGGGALAFIAMGELTVIGTLDVSGGKAGDGTSNSSSGHTTGGGGSGGAILLAATSLDLSGATLNAKGGGAGNTTHYGAGGGGGGRIALYSRETLDDLPNYSVVGGATSTGTSYSGTVGLVGTFASYSGSENDPLYFPLNELLPIPEPASLGLLGLALLGLRKRRS